MEREPILSWNNDAHYGRMNPLYFPLSWYLMFFFVLLLCREYSYLCFVRWCTVINRRYNKYLFEMEGIYLINKKQTGSTHHCFMHFNKTFNNQTIFSFYTRKQKKKKLAKFVSIFLILKEINIFYSKK